MSSTKLRVTDAAVELVGREGIHALTHARVDTAAGVPRGSTSNYFRSRAALLAGVVARLEELDRAGWEAIYDAAIPSVDALTSALAAYIDDAAGPARVRTIARYTLFMESVLNEDIRSHLTQGRERLERWAQRVVTDLGARDPGAATVAITAHLDGLILHRLALPASTDVRPMLQKVIHAAIA